jgi:cyclopropane-fatty-acyl-phospholipid synthase
VSPIVVATRLFASPSRTFTVELWDGRVLRAPRDDAPGSRVVLRTPAALDAFFPPAAEHRLAEAVLDGQVELEGDAIALIEAASRWRGPAVGLWLAAPAAEAWGRRLRDGDPSALEARLRGGLHSVARDRKAIHHHYDVSDEFYALFLDEGMVYSCAYFARGGEGIAEAQRAKLELVCRKLALAPGERFLDVGCGWGALVEHAHRRGVRPVGITVSENQLAGARRRLGRSAPRAEIRGDDWRTLRADAPFDKVASVGMMEHVGRRRLDAYFAAIHRLLRPGGLFLNHAIADASGGQNTLPWASQRGGGFIWRYIFPDGELIPIAAVVAAAERVGFEVRDLESLREHYAETLAAWLARLEARWDEAVAIGGARRARLYRLYLAASAVGFRLGRTSVYQLLLAKRTASGRAEGLPRCRGDWYAAGPRAATAKPARGSRATRRQVAAPEARRARQR